MHIRNMHVGGGVNIGRVGRKDFGISCRLWACRVSESNICVGDKVTSRNHRQVRSGGVQRTKCMRRRGRIGTGHVLTCRRKEEPHQRSKTREGTDTPVIPQDTVSHALLCFPPTTRLRLNLKEGGCFHRHCHTRGSTAREQVPAAGEKERGSGRPWNVCASLRVCAVPIMRRGDHGSPMLNKLLRYLPLGARRFVSRHALTRRPAACMCPQTDAMMSVPFACTPAPYISSCREIFCHRYIHNEKQDGGVICGGDC